MVMVILNLFAEIVGVVGRQVLAFALLEAKIEMNAMATMMIEFFIFKIVLKFKKMWLLKIVIKILMVICCVGTVFSTVVVCIISKGFPRDILFEK